MSELISPEYAELNRELHTRGEKFGTSGWRWEPNVRAIIKKHEIESVLDYGCGKGTLKGKIGDIVSEYDPAIPGKDADPEPADLVICTDVLEHIEPEKLDSVLLHLRGKTKKKLFANISLKHSRLHRLADGRNPHLIVEPAQWWLERLEPYFKVEEVNEKGTELILLAQPVSILSAVKTLAAWKDERNGHTRVNVLKTPKRIPDGPLPGHNCPAIIVCYGPSLKDTWHSIKKERKKLGATVVSVSGAHDFLRQNSITPDIHIECDPRPHKAKMMRKRSHKTKYYMASCCHPDVIDALEGHDLTLWHLYNGEESFEIRDIKSEETCAMIPGGGSVGLRTISLLHFLGFRNFIIHGMDSSFAEEEQHAGPHSGKVQNTMSVNPAATIGGESVRSKRWFTTSAVLVSYANQMLKDLRDGRFPGCNFYWHGDGLFQEMLRLQNAQIMALAEKQTEYAPPAEYLTKENAA